MMHLLFRSTFNVLCYCKSSQRIDDLHTDSALPTQASTLLTFRVKNGVNATGMFKETTPRNAL